MEETELEEGEALCYIGVDEDSTIDPDVALSYIDMDAHNLFSEPSDGEKLQDVLGHFQKDFEGGVSAENLGKLKRVRQNKCESEYDVLNMDQEFVRLTGAKFGGYGSFLPTYQRSPSRCHVNTAPGVHKNSTPNSAKRFHSEDQRQDSSASRNVLPTARLHDASGKTMLMGNSLKVDVDLPFRNLMNPV